MLLLAFSMIVVLSEPSGFVIVSSKLWRTNSLLWILLLNGSTTLLEIFIHVICSEILQENKDYILETLQVANLDLYLFLLRKVLGEEREDYHSLEKLNEGKEGIVMSM